ncbi:hypothetical protein ACK1KB_02915 [Chryseobacterium sp. TY3]
MSLTISLEEFITKPFSYSYEKFLTNNEFFNHDKCYKLILDDCCVDFFKWITKNNLFDDRFNLKSELSLIDLFVEEYIDTEDNLDFDYLILTMRHPNLRDSHTDHVDFLFYFFDVLEINDYKLFKDIYFHLYSEKNIVLKLKKLKKERQAVEDFYHLDI